MKKKLLWMIVAVLTLSLCLVSCAQNGDSGMVGGGGGGYMSPGVPTNGLDYATSEKADASKSKESTGETTEEKTDAGEITEERVDDQRNAGLITACAWDDNHSYMASNETSLSVIAAAYRFANYPNGETDFWDRQETAFWLSDGHLTSYDDGGPHILQYGNQKAAAFAFWSYRDEFPAFVVREKTNGYPIRCLKD